MAANQSICLLAATDIITALLAVATAFMVTVGRMPETEDLLKLGPLACVTFMFIILFTSFLVETSNRQHDLGLQGLGAKAILSICLSFIILALLCYPIGFFSFGKGVLVVSLLMFGIYRFVCHAGYRFCARRSGFAERVLMLSSGAQAAQLGKLIPTSHCNYVLAGFIRCADEPDHGASEKIWSLEDGLYTIARREKADKIVVSLSERRGLFPLKDVMICKLNGIEIVDAPSFYEQLTGKLLLESITPSWFIFSEGFKFSTRRQIAKRAMDLICCVIGMLITLPLLPFAALAIKLDSRGPVFFRQRRVGQGENIFTLYKFRTMREDAESETGARWAEENDLRITRVGRIFRKCRIDEFPQFFNVLRGDMSLIGPRPERLEFVEKLKEIIPYYSERHVVKPGVTGWAQVRYPYGASAEDAIEKLRYDLYYIKNLSMVFDLAILIQTIGVVLFRRGSR